MGAADDYRQYDGKLTQAQVRKQFRLDQASACAEYGSGSGSYAGHIGIKNGLSFPTSGTFADSDDAGDYLADNDKWGPAWAVRYLTTAKPTAAQQKRIDALSEKADAALTAWNRGIAAERTAVREAKSQFIGCKGCKSKLSRKHLPARDGGSCPLCQHSLLSASAQKRIAKADTKKTNARLALIDYRAKATKQGKPVWLVGGSCAS